MSEVRKYVLGYVFESNGRNVICIVKEHPEFQKGKINGVGGKVEPGETPTQAMSREFKEEVGFVYDIDWKSALIVTSGPDDGCDTNWKMEIFYAVNDDVFKLIGHSLYVNPTDEQVVVLNADYLRPIWPLMNNVQWHVSMFQNFVRNPHDVPNLPIIVDYHTA